MTAVTTLSAKGTATVETTLASYEGRVVATSGRLRVYAPRGVTLYEADYVSIDKTARRAWTVTLADGTTVAVEGAGCGCNRNR